MADDMKSKDKSAKGRRDMQSKRSSKKKTYRKEIEQKVDVIGNQAYRAECKSAAIARMLVIKGFCTLDEINVEIQNVIQNKPFLPPEEQPETPMVYNPQGKEKVAEKEVVSDEGTS